ncbi:Elsinochromes biosynthesis cluster protein HP1 [Pseudocercospora fuligena]|uniref:Elsinochromes biosynthesis cluster protein HP1 n=1 Tax=Pseudocercospora fuligena TaxID=685502 RepID=A0A8H6VFE4_9PEZI|nr:Elsinochromes biosynthesis cluster protein HP1 [Pseudocercospora fuligena]
MKRPDNCWELISQGTQAKGDPDISGLGVIIAFVLSACLTLLAVLIAYFGGLVDDGLLRPVDRFVLRIPSRAEKHTSIHVALRKAILTLSDQQIVTGIAILGAGFVGLRSGSITVYHFNIVIYLAWMSSSVHLSALTILRPFLYYHRGVAAWRLLGMLTLLLMLLIALVPSVSNDWNVVTIWARPQDHGQGGTNTAFAAPANCFWGQAYGDGVNPDAVLSFILLFISYLWKMGGMFMPVRRRFANNFRNPIDCTLEAMLSGIARSYEKKGGRRRLWAFRGGLAIYLPITALLETLGSFSAALWLSVLGLIYGIMQIIIPRELMQQVNPQLGEDESKLGFGQLMPLILLVQPLGAVTEHIWLHSMHDDEPMYRDHGGNDPYSYSLGAYREGLEAIGPSHTPLLQYMASYKTPPRTEQAAQRIELKAFLYSSKLFHMLVWLIHLVTAGVSVAVFYVDYFAIGYATSGNWYLITIAIVVWTGGAPILVLCLAPWSRLGKYWKRDRERRESVTQRFRTKGLALDTLGPVTQVQDQDAKSSPGTAERRGSANSFAVRQRSPVSPTANGNVFPISRNSR